MYEQRAGTLCGTCAFCDGADEPVALWETGIGLLVGNTRLSSFETILVGVSPNGLLFGTHGQPPFLSLLTYVG